MTPKFKIGDKVNCPRTLYDETRGEIVEITRLFRRIDIRTGEFERNGLDTLENTIRHIQLPYRFDGNTLEIDYPEETIKLTNMTIHNKAKTETSKFYGYVYTVQTPKMRTVFSERLLRHV